MKTYDVQNITELWTIWHKNQVVIEKMYAERLRDVMPMSRCTLDEDTCFKRIESGRAWFADYDGDEIGLDLTHLLNDIGEEWRAYVAEEDRLEEERRQRVSDERKARYAMTEIEQLKRLAAKYPYAL